MLERHGVEASDIELRGPGVEAAAPVTNDEQRHADMATTGAVGKRLVPGIIGGAVLGALVGLALSAFVFDGEGGALFGSALVAALVGGILGFLYAGYSGLPVNEQWGDTFEGDGGETTLVVLTDDEGAVEALKGTDPRRVNVT